MQPSNCLCTSRFAPCLPVDTHFARPVRVIVVTLLAALLQADPNCGTLTTSDPTGDTVVQATTCFCVVFVSALVAVWSRLE